MSDMPYSNREIDSHFHDIKDYLVRIESQTNKTNGRVSSLEKWKSYIAGAMAALGFIGLPLALYNFNEVKAQVKEVQDRVINTK